MSESFKVLKKVIVPHRDKPSVPLFTLEETPEGLVKIQTYKADGAMSSWVATTKERWLEAFVALFPEEVAYKFKDSIDPDEGLFDNDAEEGPNA